MHLSEEQIAFYDVAKDFALKKWPQMLKNGMKKKYSL